MSSKPSPQKLRNISIRQAQVYKQLSIYRNVLSTGLKGPFVIFWEKTEASKKLMGKDFDRIIKLLRDLEKDRLDFKLKLDLENRAA